MKQYLVSIIIPVYNSAAFLEDTLASVSAQSHVHWECICVDDGSSDSSLLILEAMSRLDQRFRVFRRPQHLPRGGNSCRNYGYSQSRGDFIQWFDADDLMRPRLLERKLKVLGAHPELDFVVSKIAEIGGEQISFIPYEIDSPNRVADFLAYRIRFFTPGPLFKKSFLQGKKLFSTALQRHQEWEFYGRLLIQGAAYKGINAYHCLRKRHENSIDGQSKQKSTFERAYLKLYAVHHLSQQIRSAYAPVFCRIFLKRCIWAILEAIRQWRLKELWFFIRLNFLLVYHYGLFYLKIGKH